jgi:hypothetical protein
MLTDFYFSNEYFWFQRSGAILCMLSISAEFKLSRIDPRNFKRSPHEFHKYLESLDYGLPTETKYEKVIKSFTHISLLVGTIVWGYGDLLFK